MTARPHLTARIAWAASAFVLVVFVVTALVMKRYNAGADFGAKDQAGTVLIGVVVALLLIMPTYPRLIADEESIRLRSFLGSYRVVPWDVVVDIRFPSRVRFAQIVLPGEETLAIYAVQRWDKQRAVEAMDGLRALLAATRPAV
ncbi:MAG: PH domain-containing protein [Jatrophihabitantaceae bacterium]